VCARQGWGDGVSDRRHGWSPVLKVRTTQDGSCSFRTAAILLHCSEYKDQAGKRNGDHRTPAMSLSHGTFIVPSYEL
jgi:hypothetical protein